MYRDKDYKNIYYLAKDYKLDTNKKYEELVPFSYILHDLFYDVDRIKDLTTFVKDSINIVKKIPDPLNNLDHLLLSSISYHNNPFSKISDLEIIFFSKEILDEDKSYSYGYFLSTFRNTLMHQLHSVILPDFSYKKFANLCLRFREIYYQNEIYKKDLSIIITIMAYCYVNDLDYSMAENYISDINGYNDLIDMNGIILNENNIENYFSIMYRRLFENTEMIFNKNKILIK